jgi:hypothetical protein
MGYLLARELRSHLPEDLALTYHLLFNHVPKVSLTFLPIAREALQLAREGEWTSKLQMPTGELLSVYAVVEQLHLEAFLNGEES